MKKLLPCPHCGGEAEINGNTSAQSINRYGEKRYWPVCKNRCPASGYGKLTYLEAVDAWNTRASIELREDVQLIFLMQCLIKILKIKENEQ